MHALHQNILVTVLVSLLLSAGSRVLGAPDANATAEALLAFEGLRPGLCVHIGSTHGDLLADLAVSGKYHVHCLTADQADLPSMRQQVASKGLYGQVVIDHNPLTHLPYVDDLINLLVIDDFAVRQRQGLNLQEIMRVVAPESTVILGNAPVVTEQLVTQAGYRDAVVNRTGMWTQIIKPRPDDMDEWPQFYHDSACTSTSSDRLVHPPNSVQWISGDLWQHETGPVSVITDRGRILSNYRDQGIVARDAFNGLELWRRRTDPIWQRRVAPRCWIAVNGQLLTLLEQEGPLVALDIDTGRTLREYSFHPKRIAYHDGVLVAHMLNGSLQAHGFESGRELWRKRVDDFSPWSQEKMILAEGRLFFTLSKARRFICLDLKTGEEVWQKPTEGDSLVCCRNGLLLSGGKSQKEGDNAFKSMVFNAAYSPRDGSLLWRHGYRAVYHGGNPGNVFYLNGLVWIHTSIPSDGVEYTKEPQAWCGLSPTNGEVVRRIKWENVKHRCFLDQATERYILSGGMDFLDVNEGEHHTFHAGRGSCSSGFTPANGLLYQPPNVCKCFSQVRGFAAFTHDALQTADGDQPQDIPHRQTGTGTAADERPSADDWPMLRRDPARSGSTTAQLPLGLQPIWETDIGRRLSSPVVACGKVFVASSNDHRVIALDAGTGREVWSFRANGRVDSPPAIYAGMAIFGCRDGWLYSVSSATGERIWALPTAPRQRWLVCQGQVESAWPLHGSVLVDADTAYYAAGRHTEVDGGMLFSAFSPKTGEVLWRRRLACDLSRPTEDGVGGIANDILISDGRTISMQHARFDAQTGLLDTRWNLAQRGVSGFLWGGSGGGLLTDIVQPIAGWHELNWRQQWVSSALGWGSHSGGLALAFSHEVIFGVRTAGDKGKARKDNSYVYEIFSTNKEGGPLDKELWRVALQAGVVPKAILNAANRVYVAALREQDGLEKGAILIYDAEDGRSLGSVVLDARPKYDGLAAVDGRLIMVDQAGKIICLGRDS